MALKQGRPGTGLLLGSAQARVYGVRGGKASQRPHESYYYVDGEPVTPSQMVTRTGLTRDTVMTKLRRLRLAGEPVTWAALGKARRKKSGMTTDKN